MTKLIATVKIGDKIIPMRSPISNFMYLLQVAFENTYSTIVVDTSNTVRNAGAYYSGGSYYYWTGGATWPAAGDATWGIQIGSNATAVALTDYKLNTQIAHGTGAGQMKYSAQSAVAVLVTGSPGTSRTFKLQRYFVNDSGNDVTIREVGIALSIYAWGVGMVPVLVCRDLTGDITITDGNAVPVEITWQVTA